MPSDRRREQKVELFAGGSAAAKLESWDHLQGGLKHHLNDVQSNQQIIPGMKGHTIRNKASERLDVEETRET